MVKIIVCDDDSFTLRLLVSLLETAIQKSGCPAKLSCIASSGQELLRFIKKSPGPYLYFLDYDFGKNELNGIDLVKQIYQADEKGQIVFVTSHSEKGMEILKSGVRALGFIEKTPEGEQMVSQYVKYLSMAAGNNSAGRALPGNDSSGRALSWNDSSGRALSENSGNASGQGPCIRLPVSFTMAIRELDNEGNAVRMAWGSTILRMI